jgi:enoyl-CoA hydratase/carnithine racemase
VEYKLLKLEKKEGVGIVYFDNPKTMNATNPQSVAELTAAFIEVNNDPEVRAVIFM